VKPDDLFDREREWADLNAFVRSSAKGVRIGIVHGRRRTGKSFLLRRLVAAHGGLYHMALEEETAPALGRFAAALARGLALPAGTLRFDDWAQALRAATERYRVVVLDELPYLLRHSAGAAIPSVLQLLVDESRADDGPPRRVIVCGSALLVMTELLSGGTPLRGRADLDLRLGPFDYRTTAAYYRIQDPEVGFRLHAVVGGTPGYRDLLAEASPANTGELETLLTATLLNPSHALFGEADHLLREDPRVTDRAIYHSVLAAIASGATTPSKVAAAIGRPERSVFHPLEVLTTAGFVVRDDDVLLQRRPALRLADPIVRFHQLVVAPRLASFEERAVAEAWRDAQATVRSRIHGPHFEDLARAWVRRFASTATVGEPVGEVGTTIVNDRVGRATLELDVVALARGQRRQAKDARLVVLGEAKASASPRGTGDLRRLERARELLVGRGVDAARARLLLFARSGFDRDLEAAARSRSDVELVDLERLWTGS
jgi:hypothetical protein